MVSPESLNQCMKSWVSSLIPSLAEKLEVEEEQNKKKKKSLTIAIDGKEIRSTGKMKKYDSPLHIVSAQIGERGLTLAQETVQSKSNEIPAVQELITTLENRRMHGSCRCLKLSNTDCTGNYRCKSRLFIKRER